MDSIEILHGRGGHSLNLAELSLKTCGNGVRIKRSAQPRMRGSDGRRVGRVESSEHAIRCQQAWVVRSEDCTHPTGHQPPMTLGFGVGTLGTGKTFRGSRASAGTSSFKIGGSGTS
jgi:hypothetical protein